MLNWNKYVTRFSAMAVLAALAACGGGDGGGGGGGGGGASKLNTTSITSSQAVANSVVADINVGVAQIRGAESSGNVSLPGGVEIEALPTGATTSATINCSMLGGSGTGTITYKITTTGSGANTVPVSYKYTYKNCSYVANGITVTFNGSGALEYQNYSSLTDTTYTLTTSFEDLEYSYVGNGINETYTLNTSQTCDFSDSNISCHYSFGNSTITNIDASTSGRVTTIRSASIDGANIDIVYTNWAFDAATGHATAGSVTVTDSNGNKAVVTVTSSGYNVAITVSGTTTPYTVAFTS